MALNSFRFVIFELTCAFGKKLVWFPIASLSGSSSLMSTYQTNLSSVNNKLWINRETKRQTFFTLTLGLTNINLLFLMTIIMKFPVSIKLQ